MVGRGDADGVDVLAVEQPAVVAGGEQVGGFRFLLDEAGGGGEVVLVEVAEGDDLGGGLPGEVAEVG